MDLNRFKTCSGKFAHCRVLVVGDLMIDEYLWGEVDRISPEAPVQVVEIEKEDFTLGGAGNVVNNLAALGAQVSVVGVTGTGAGGKLLLDRFESLGVDTCGIIREEGRPTTRKTRVIADHQHVLRIDRETRAPVSDETIGTACRIIGEKMASCDIVLVSDYGKGLLTEALLRRLFGAAEKHGKVTIVDPKGHDYSKYKGATLLTPNRKEASLAAGIEITDERSLLTAGQKIRTVAKLDKLLITRGKEGMVLLDSDKEPFTIRSKARQVFDVSGAGDTVASVLGLSVAAGMSFTEGATLANIAAGIVVAKVGTATVTAEEIAASIAPDTDPGREKVKTLAELALIAEDLRRKGRKLVLTNGCFDLLHAGHIRLFSASRQLGDQLVVAIDDDQSVRELKGDGRPVIRAEERVRILSALGSIDYVTVFASGELDRVIEALRPDVLTKGSNYAAEEVVGHKLVEKLGGRVELVAAGGESSATDIISSIRKT